MEPDRLCRRVRSNPALGKFKLRHYRVVLVLAPSKIRYYNDELPLFGQLVAEKFPAASYDIEEAGKCLALLRSTACAFHLMRVTEFGIWQLAGSLGVDLGEKWGWLKILNSGLEPAINALPEATESEKERKRAFQQIRGHLHAIRLGWRNDTMHPKQTYTEAEAESLFIHVETFMRHLADRI